MKKLHNLIVPSLIIIVGVVDVVVVDHDGIDDIVDHHGTINPMQKEKKNKMMHEKHSE